MREREKGMNLFWHLHKEYCLSRIYKEKGISLFNVLKCVVAFFAGSYFDNVFNVVYKDFAVADVTCVKHFFSSNDKRINRNFANYDLNQNYRQ